MPYRNDIPQPTDDFARSSANIRNNFIAIQNAFQTDHGAFNGNFQGQHGKVSFNETTTPTFALGEIGLYAITPTLPLPETGRTELVLVKSDGTNVVLTGSEKAQSGWAYLPSGLLFKWGTVSIVGKTTFVFPTFGNTIPVFNNVFNAQACVVNPTNADIDAYVIVSGFTTTTLTLFVTNRTTLGNDTQNVNYFVIGN